MLQNHWGADEDLAGKEVILLVRGKRIIIVVTRALLWSLN
jgi:hypothetical protein